MKHWTELMAEARHEIDTPGHPDYGQSVYSFSAVALLEFAASYRKEKKVTCMSCEKEVDYSTGIFTCSECSK